eukprot:3272079-Rhodomonas_salina.4
MSHTSRKAGLPSGQAGTVHDSLPRTRQARSETVPEPEPVWRGAYHGYDDDAEDDDDGGGCGGDDGAGGHGAGGAGAGGNAVWTIITFQVQ